MKIRCSNRECDSRIEGGDEGAFNLNSVFGEDKELAENTKKVEAEAFECCFCQSEAESVPPTAREILSSWSEDRAADRLEEGLLAPDFCKHCGEEGCLKHCPISKDGKHEADQETITPLSLKDTNHSKENDMVADVTCKHCSQSGSFVVLQREVNWE